MTADDLAEVDERWKKQSSQVHTENTDTWVVLDTQVDVLLDPETEIAGLREVSTGYQSILIGCDSIPQATTLQARVIEQPDQSSLARLGHLEHSATKLPTTIHNM